MPVTSTAHATENHRMVRLLRCVRGEMTFDLDIAARFDYGRASHELHMTAEGGVFTSRGSALTFHIVREPGDERLAEPRADGNGDCHASFTLRAGQLRGLVMETASAGPPRAIRVAEAQRMLHDTSRFWRVWLSHSTNTGRWREALERSAITLKLMTYAPSGGLVAAPTAGLPEQVGGERNWDYRYTWFRDASFSVHTLLRMGFVEEAAAFGRWLADRVEEKAGGASGPLNIIYRVDGSSDLSEETLEHWEGYRGSRPVRIGRVLPTSCSWTSTARRLKASTSVTRRASPSAPGAGSLCATPSTGSRSTGTSPRRASGRRVAGARTSPTVGSCAGAPSIVRSDSPRTGRALHHWIGGWPPGTRSTTRCWSADGMPTAARSCSTTAARCSTRRCCGCRPSSSSHRWTPCGFPRCERWRPSWSQTASSTGTTLRRPRTGCGAQRAPSRCARSPTWTRSPVPAE